MKRIFRSGSTLTFIAMSATAYSLMISVPSAHAASQPITNVVSPLLNPLTSLFAPSPETSPHAHATQAPLITTSPTSTPSLDPRIPVVSDIIPTQSPTNQTSASAPITSAAPQSSSGSTAQPSTVTTIRSESAPSNTVAMTSSTRISTSPRSFIGQNTPSAYTGRVSDGFAKLTPLQVVVGSLVASTAFLVGMLLLALSKINSKNKLSSALFGNRLQ